MSQCPGCPDCGVKLQKVTQSPNSMLNREQFDAAKVGDWFCEDCTSNVTRTGYKYFWTHELPK